MAKNKVIEMHTGTPDQVLDQAKGEFNSLFVVGWDKGGSLTFRTSKGLTYENVNWMIDCMKARIVGEIDSE